MIDAAPSSLCAALYTSACRFYTVLDTGSRDFSTVFNGMLHFTHHAGLALLVGLLLVGLGMIYQNKQQGKRDYEFEYHMHTGPL